MKVSYVGDLTTLGFGLWICHWWAALVLYPIRSQCPTFEAKLKCCMFSHAAGARAGGDGIHGIIMGSRCFLELGLV